MKLSKLKLDSLFYPLIGVAADRTNTRWGKFRPWVLWTAIPFGAAFWAMYVVPNVGPQGKLIYAAITYVLVMILYSANNTPYSALLGVISADSGERSIIARATASTVRPALSSASPCAPSFAVSTT